MPQKNVGGIFKGMSDERVVWLNGAENLPIQPRVDWMGTNGA